MLPCSEYTRSIILAYSFTTVESLICYLYISKGTGNIAMKMKVGPLYAEILGQLLAIIYHQPLAMQLGH